MQFACRRLTGRCKLAERAKELFDWETDPEGQLKQWLLFMIIDEFTSVRTDENRQSHVGNHTSDPVYLLRRGL